MSRHTYTDTWSTWGRCAMLKVKVGESDLVWNRVSRSIVFNRTSIWSIRLYLFDNKWSIKLCLKWRIGRFGSRYLYWNEKSSLSLYVLSTGVSAYFRSDHKRNSLIGLISRLTSVQWSVLHFHYHMARVRQCHLRLSCVSLLEAVWSGTLRGCGSEIKYGTEAKMDWNL